MSRAQMPTFLEEVAEDLYQRYGETLSHCRMLFPSRRARIFFEEAIAEQIERPIWQPHYSSIDELMGDLAGLHLGDKLLILSDRNDELAAHYKEYGVEDIISFK